MKVVVPVDDEPRHAAGKGCKDTEEGVGCESGPSGTWTWLFDQYPDCNQDFDSSARSGN